MTSFISKNEDGEIAWQLVLDRVKDITRRKEPKKAGSEFAVQPGRGKKAVCRARVISCMRHIDWENSLPLIDGMLAKASLNEWHRREAIREGFKSWGYLLDWFEKRNIDINKTYRIEFELVKS